MAHTYDQVTRADAERTGYELDRARRRKRTIAIGVVIAGLAGTLAAAYFSYRGVPAPDNPANSRPNLVEPYR
jgi:hypothetical protein